MDYSAHFEGPRLRREHLQMQNESTRPSVIRECICRNGHMPDEAGWVSTDPNCLVHRPHRGFVDDRARPPSAEEKAEVEATIAAQRAIVVMQQKRRAKRAAAKRQNRG